MKGSIISGKPFIFSSLLVVLVAVSFVGYFLFKEPSDTGRKPVITTAGSSFNTRIESNGVEIAIHVALPKVPRYEEGAPVVVKVPTFFTPEKQDFSKCEDLTEVGMIEICLLFPGQSERGGAQSGGENDYGGERSLEALRDVIKFAAGEKENKDGFTLDDLSEVKPLFSNVGLYAFSHPGIAATNVLAFYGNELPDHLWFVGRENPTVAAMSSLEIGHYAEDDKSKIFNTLYKPSLYSSNSITVDYSSAYYDPADSRPYFDLNSNSQLDSGDHELGTKVPTMFGKRFYSVELLTALRDNGLSQANWPDDLATPEEAQEVWPYRETVGNYSKLKKSAPNLHIMLIFADDDHVQVAPDKPHIHQAYDGFTNAGLWVRLNPDAAYVEALNPVAAGRSSEHDANSEPDDWNNIVDWGYPAKSANHLLVPLAAVAEMADRAKDDNWSHDLQGVLYDF